MIVVDASAVVELLLGGRRGDPVLDLLQDEEGEVHAPGLLDVEVLQALRRNASDDNCIHSMRDVMSSMDTQGPRYTRKLG